MDTLPLPPKAPVLASDLAAKPLASVLQSSGTSITQTAQAVQALNKADAEKLPLSVQADQELSAEQLSDMAEQMDKFVGSFTHELKFRVDEDSGRNVVTVIDSKSGDTIRQIPTEELLDVIARLADASGGLIDIKA